MNSGLPDQDLLRVTAALLNRGCSIDRLSRLMIVAALLALMGSGLAGGAGPILIVTLVLSALAGLVSLYFSVRVGFDAALFLQVADAKEGPVDLQGLDLALVDLGLLPRDKAGRPVKARVSGAMRLFRYQIGVALLQLILILVAAILAGLG